MYVSFIKENGIDFFKKIAYPNNRNRKIVERKGGMNASFFAKEIYRKLFYRIMEGVPMKLSDARKYKKQIKSLYKVAFPRDERAPISLLFRKTGNERNAFYAALDNDEFVGLVYTVRVESLVYVFYLAVVEEKRGHGYGSRILELIRKLYPDCVITLEIEDTEDANADNKEQRIKRLRFYEANGYKQLHIKINEAGVVYELLGTADTITQAKFLEMMKQYFGPILFRMIYKETILTQ